MNLHWFSIISGIISIIAAIFTVVVYFNTKSIKEQIIKDAGKKEYKESKSSVIKSLSTYLELMTEDNIYDDKIKIDIIKEISILESYNEYNNKSLKTKMNKIKRIAENNVSKRQNFNKQKICILLSELLGNLERDKLDISDVRSKL